MYNSRDYLEKDGGHVIREDITLISVQVDRLLLFVQP